MADHYVEPWMRGPIAGVSPFLAPLIYSFQMAREDLSKHTAALTAEQLWARPSGAAPVGFHIRHIGGSVDRLITYVQGRPLTEAQLAALRAEMEPGATLPELLDILHSQLDAAEAVVRALPLDVLAQPRTVGRKALPTTVIGLIVHAAEHTQRHVGQAITTARIVAGR